MRGIFFLRQNSLSTFTVFVSVFAAVLIRFSYYTNDAPNGYNATTWDAFGYYSYLPATFIYHDTRDLSWIPAIDKKYHVVGDKLYQADTLENGRMAFKYLGGVAVMQTPFFAAGHILAKIVNAPPDGFSWPYQYAIIWGAVFYFGLGIIVLRRVLLFYFSDGITALTILIVSLGTNVLQYVSVDGAMSHVYIFPLYAILLYLTHSWHLKPRARTLFWIAFVIGLATICRPTEGVMIFIPLLWKWQSDAASTKWNYLWSNKIFLLVIVLGFTAGIFPQLAYWKYTTGSWVYNVGSKWNFLNPWWRVLFGMEKGWFIYTPLTLLFAAGLFFAKHKPFHRVLLVFGLLNIWIIISWSDWRYGASYSTRAMVQSYPVYGLAAASLLTQLKKQWLLFLSPVILYLIVVNLFQIWQYNANILHYSDMNGRYYRAIYLKSHPTPLDYSLMDSAVVRPKEWKPTQIFQYRRNDTLLPNGHTLLLSVNPESGKLLHLRAELCSPDKVFGFQWAVEEYKKGQLVHTYLLRLGVPRCEDQEWRKYEGYFTMHDSDSLVVTLQNCRPVKVKSLKVTAELE